MIIHKTDGFINWDKIPRISLTQAVWSPNPAPEVSVQGTYAVDDALYFRIESSRYPARAVNTERDSSVWEDDCLECFVSFDGNQYVNLEANANGALRAGIGTDRKNRKLIDSLDFREKPTVQSMREKDSWYVIFRIPDAFIKEAFAVSLHSGMRFTGNFYCCGDKTDNPYYACWNEILTDAPDYHRPEYFGQLELE